MKKTCSVVLIDRNDGYKDLKRAMYCINSFVDIYDEIWFIDWCTPKENPPLLNAIIDHIPKTGKIRNVVINKEMEKELVGKNLKTIPNSIAINIGIRRSACDYIVSSGGIDIFGPKKIDLNSLLPTLKDDTFYTISRRELNKEELYKYEVENWKDALNYFCKNSDPRYYYGGCTPNDWYSIINCPGDFQIAHRDIWYKIKGFEEKMLYRCFIDTNVQKKAILNKYKVEALFEPPFFHISHPPYVQNPNGETAESGKWNDHMYWVEYFGKSENTENWGFPEIEFNVEVI